MQPPKSNAAMRHVGCGQIINLTLSLEGFCAQSMSTEASIAVQPRAKWPLKPAASDTILVCWITNHGPCRQEMAMTALGSARSSSCILTRGSRWATLFVAFVALLFKVSSRPADMDPLIKIYLNMLQIFVYDLAEVVGRIHSHLVQP